MLGQGKEEKWNKKLYLILVFKWFLDNKAVTVFLVALLLGLNILSKISFLFIPVIGFFISSHVAGYRDCTTS